MHKSWTHPDKKYCFTVHNVLLIVKVHGIVYKQRFSKLKLYVTNRPKLTGNLQIILCTFASHMQRKELPKLECVFTYLCADDAKVNSS
jgi:hypothetical protein